MFGRNRRKMDNAAAVSIPRPVAGPTTIHQHGVSWPGVIIAGFVCALSLLPVLWWVLVFLFDKMGSRNPEQEAAFWVVMVPGLFLAGWLLKWVTLDWFDRYQSFKLEMEREVTRREELRLAAAQSALEPGRMNETDYEFAKVVLAVMMTAYNWLAQNNYDKFPARWRPWSMRSALEAGERIGVKLTQERANAVSVWLHQKGVITSPDGGQIVTKKYKDLDSVRAMLDREFGKPIMVVSPALRDNRGFEHI